jgi:hypothetical protein
MPGSTTPAVVEAQWKLPPDERAYLRELASRQAEYAALPVMAERRRQWFDLNDGRANVRPPFILEATNFMFELLPDRRYRCRSAAGQAIEKELVRNTRPHEVYRDDRVVPETLDIPWFMEIDEFGPDVKVSVDHAVDAEGMAVGYGFNFPITSLTEDLPRLRPAVVSVDKERTYAWKAFVEELLGDLLPVEIRLGNHVSMTLTQRLIHLMGMEAFFLACYEEPDAVHAVMAFLRDNALGIMRQQEELGLLSLNNNHQEAWESSLNYTNLLPAPGYDPAHLRWADRWNATNLQEATGMRPSMASEFLYPYVHEIARPVGLLYYGCCEAVHQNWDDIRTLPHLKKVSISQWTDEAVMGEALGGTGIVYSRKPNPNFLSVDETLDESAWAEHIRKTMDAARGCSTELLVRDVYTLHHNPDNARRAAAIALEEIDRHWQA